MSDANKQSVERCEYRHEWIKVMGEHPIPYPHFECSVCGFRPKEESKLYAQAGACVQLRKWLQPGAVVKTILRHVSRSGMNRRVSLVISMDGEPKDITWSVAHALGDPIKNRAGYVQDAGIEVGGCGMDVGFELVYNLGRVLWPRGF